MPEFDENCNIDSYLLLFERIAHILKWNKDEWAIRLATQLKGKAAEVYTHLTLEQSQDYEVLKTALLTRYKLTEETYRKQFRSEKKSWRRNVHPVRHSTENAAKPLDEPREEERWKLRRSSRYDS
jgi:hypothetical protein